MVIGSGPTASVTELLDTMSGISEERTRSSESEMRLVVWLKILLPYWKGLQTALYFNGLLVTPTGLQATAILTYLQKNLTRLRATKHFAELWMLTL